MRMQAVLSAKARLERARAAFSNIEAEPLNLDHQETAWWAFLLATNGIYSKLEQGSKASTKSTAWFGKVKGRRRKDPLLSYLHHARNSDEHGLESVTQRHSLDLEAREGAEIIRDEAGKPIEIRVQAGIPVDIRPVLPKLSLLTVVDRHGVSFDPPTVHLGHDIHDLSPVGIARLALLLLESLVSEAEGLAA